MLNRRRFFDVDYRKRYGEPEFIQEYGKTLSEIRPGPLLQGK
jgi:hypothetical protein